uniref:Uncharacterized protein n=1 Tax=Plectus sambesii TaxID=2011161 RepID=A0A914VVS5_9BILA
MLPTATERGQYNQLISGILSAKDASVCSQNLLSQYPEIADDIEVRYYQKSYCIVAESKLHPTKNIFRRSWGYVIIADDTWSKLDVYHSAPHFQSDLHTDIEAVMIFNMTRSRAVAINGASRFAVQDGVKSPCITEYYAADASHDNRTMFFVANSAMLAHQGASCPHEHCAFIQWHGMAAGSCPDANVFVSTGISNSHNTYSLPGLPANKIVAAFNQLGMGVAKTPKESICNLVAAENVFGRLINGVTTANVCKTAAASSGVTGEFVHIEQEPSVRAEFEKWTQIINSAFPL